MLRECMSADVASGREVYAGGGGEEELLGMVGGLKACNLRLVVPSNLTVLFTFPLFGLWGRFVVGHGNGYWVFVQAVLRSNVSRPDVFSILTAGFGGFTL
jgi:hypothetical protein